MTRRDGRWLLTFLALVALPAALAHDATLGDVPCLNPALSL